ncbi:zinc ribbon domain-containing protein [Actinacidiphila acididurans]|uniref:Zinc-ribbon domain-containing protein n=1 Tax=Actinacidiphila acididurans TaxID=2784346 RepID=A0ABS2TNG6_9ACTN|nr:zinc ribbon domain-containing protein [Actinacidiphila acididurans]MBM9504885.1 hypothetical protein [Actinacidiphila acididurans]
MPLCPACGAQVPDADDVRFCARCGHELAPAAGGPPDRDPDPDPGAGEPPIPPLPSAPPTAGAGPDVPPVPTAPPSAAVPPGSVPPPAYAPTAVLASPGGEPSAAGRFLRRVVTGSWGSAAAAGAAPVLVLTAFVAVVTAVTGQTEPYAFVSWWTRARIVTGAMMQAFGGSLRITTREPAGDPGFSQYGTDGSDGSDGSSDFGTSDGSDGSDPFGSSGGSDGSSDFGGSDGSDGSSGFGSSDGTGDFGGSDGSSDFGGTDGSDGSSDFGDTGSGSGFDDPTGTGSFEYHQSGGSGSIELGGGPGTGSSGTVHQTLSMVPLSVTLLWIAVLWLALRALRRRGQAGPEAAVRVAVVAAAGALVLALVGQPSPGVAHISDRPFVVVPVAFLVSLVVALAVLAGPAWEGRLAARPGAAAALRVLRTALLALLLCALLAGVVVLIVALRYYSGVTGWGVFFVALLLPNAGTAGLDLGWGGPVRFKTGFAGRTVLSHGFGLSDLSKVWHGWAVVLAVGVGLVCALLIGALAVRRSRGRSERLAVAGVFTALFTGLAALSGLSMHGLAAGGVFGAGTGSAGSAAPELLKALLFGLLWSVGGVLVMSYAARLRRNRNGGPAWPVPPPVGGPRPAPAAAGTVPDGPPVVPAGTVPDRPSVPPQAPGPPAAGDTVMDLGLLQPDRPDRKPPRHL